MTAIVLPLRSAAVLIGESSATIVTSVGAVLSDMPAGAMIFTPKPFDVALRDRADRGEADVERARDHRGHERAAVGERRDLNVDAGLVEPAEVFAVEGLPGRFDRLNADAHRRRRGRAGRAERRPPERRRAKRAPCAGQGGVRASPHLWRDAGRRLR